MCFCVNFIHSSFNAAFAYVNYSNFWTICRHRLKHSLHAFVMITDLRIYDRRPIKCELFEKVRSTARVLYDLHIYET